MGSAGSVLLGAAEVSSAAVVVSVPGEVTLSGRAVAALGWWLRVAAGEALARAELEEVPVPGLGAGEMVSRIQSLSWVILEYTPGFVAWAQPIPQLTMPAR